MSAPQLEVLVISVLFALLWGVAIFLLFRGPSAQNTDEDPNFQDNEVFNLYNTDREMALARVQSGQMDLTELLENQWKYEDD